VSWGNQIRSYVLDQSRIKDLRTGVEIGNTTAVLDGALDEFMQASLNRVYSLTDYERQRRESFDRGAGARSSRNSRAGKCLSNDFRRKCLGRISRRPTAAKLPRRLAAQAGARRVAGRLRRKNVMGKAVREDRGRQGGTQVRLERDTLHETYENFKTWDIGDVIGVEGVLFMTKTGELTVKADARCCSPNRCGPCPTSGTASPTREMRYRRRYVDLIMTEESRRVSRCAAPSCATSAPSWTLAASGSRNSPMLHPIPGGAAARPFKDASQRARTWTVSAHRIRSCI